DGQTGGRVGQTANSRADNFGRQKNDRITGARKRLWGTCAFNIPCSRFDDQFFDSLAKSQSVNSRRESFASVVFAKAETRTRDRKFRQLIRVHFGAIVNLNTVRI